MSKRSHLRKEDSFNLGNWSINPALCVASHDGIDHELSIKMSEVIAYLGRYSKRIVTRTELIDEYWEGNYSVGEKALTNTVWQLRKIFEDDPNHSIFIQTAHRNGYKLLTTPIYHHEPENGIHEQTGQYSNLAPLVEPQSNIAKRLYFISTAVLAISLAAVLTNSPSTNNIRKPHEVKITDFPGRELNIALSPDGQHMAFRWIPLSETSNLFIKSLTDPDAPLKQITFTDVEEFNPTWSADSSHLAYTGISTSGDCQIYIMNMSTFVERPLDTCIRVSPLKWSPDGRWLAYTGQLNNANSRGIYLKDMQSLLENPLLRTEDVRVSCGNCSFLDTDISWSPDSQQLAVSRKPHSLSENIYIYSLQEKRFTQITEGLANIRGHTWTQDGEHLLYVNNTDVRNRLMYQINIKTKEQKNLGIRNAGKPVYSSDFKDVYYYHRQVDNSVSYINLEHEITHYPFPVAQTSHDEIFGSYSEPLDKIIYLTDASGHYEIWMSDINGSNSKQLTHLKQKIIYPSWSNNGKYIAFISADEISQNNSLYILDIDTLHLKLLETPFQDHGAPNWSHNDTTLIVPVTENAQTNIWRIPTSTDKPTPLTKTGGLYARESSDGKYLYFYKAPASNALFRLRYLDGKEEIVIDNKNISWANWDITDEKLYFISHYPSYDSIESIDFRSKEKLVLVKIPNRLISSSYTIQYINNKNLLFFTQREVQQIDIMKIADPAILDD